MNNQGNKRNELRVSIETIILPFLATRDDNHQPFEYLLIDISSGGAKFAIPRWAASRERLETGDVINLHLPLLDNGSSFAKGKVVWKGWDETTYAELFGVTLFQKTSVNSPVAVSVEKAGIVGHMENVKSLPKYLSKTIKDCFLLKKGISVYLKHLIPYFSRIGDYPNKDYQRLKDTVLEDIRNHVLANHNGLSKLHRQLDAHCLEADDIPKMLNLEEFRAMIESEVSSDIFSTMFESVNVVPYVSAIKELEKKLYANFNITVMIYILAL